MYCYHVQAACCEVVGDPDSVGSCGSVLCVLPGCSVVCSCGHSNCTCRVSLLWEKTLKYQKRKRRIINLSQVHVILYIRCYVNTNVTLRTILMLYLT